MFLLCVHPPPPIMNERSCVRMGFRMSRRHARPKGEEQTSARRDGVHTPRHPEYVIPFLHARLSMFHI
jgi:hypothetical protein